MFLTNVPVDNVILTSQRPLELYKLTGPIRRDTLVNCPRYAKYPPPRLAFLKFPTEMCGLSQCVLDYVDRKGGGAPLYVIFATKTSSSCYDQGWDAHYDRHCHVTALADVDTEPMKRSDPSAQAVHDIPEVGHENCAFGDEVPNFDREIAGEDVNEEFLNDGDESQVLQQLESGTKRNEASANSLSVSMNSDNLLYICESVSDHL